jgi:hypothetical protein
MDYPNRKRLVLVFVLVVTCSVWLAVDVNTKNEASNASKPLDQTPRVMSLAEPLLPAPAHQSMAVEARNRAAPVLGD